MTDSLTPIGTYWYGPKLGPLERACLISMMGNGHSVTLFSHEKVAHVPKGVNIQDARDITGKRPILMFRKYERKKGIISATLFSDQFRYHMIKQTGWIWLDLDAYVLKPLRPFDSGYLFGYQSDNHMKKGIIANGVLGLPKHSPTLKDLLSFTEDEYPIPPFYNLQRRSRFYCWKMLGKPVHISMQPWGTWGPQALTYFLKKNGESKHALHNRMLFPIALKDADQFFLPRNQVKDMYDDFLKDALSVHIFGTIIREKVRQGGGWYNIPRDSYLQELISPGL